MLWKLDEQAFKALPTQVQEQIVSMRKSISLLRKRLLGEQAFKPKTGINRAVKYTIGACAISVQTK